MSRIVVILSEDQVDNPSMTPAEIEAVLPPHLQGVASQELADHLNNIAQDPEYARGIRDNFVTYTGVLKEGKFKVEDYVNAVAYVSYKLMGYSNRDSYARTFPARYANLAARGASDKDIAAHVSMYNKNKLVNLILEQTLIPTWVLNQDAYQKAINTQLDLMMNAKSEMVKTNAANSILTHLKQPEKKEVSISIDTPETSGMRELKDTLTKLAEQQRTLINQGVPTREIAHQSLMEKVIEGSAIDITPAQQDADE